MIAACIFLPLSFPFIIKERFRVEVECLASLPLHPQFCRVQSFSRVFPPWRTSSLLVLGLGLINKLINHLQTVIISNLLSLWCSDWSISNTRGPFIRDFYCCITLFASAKYSAYTNHLLPCVCIYAHVCVLVLATEYPNTHSITKVRTI